MDLFKLYFALLTFASSSESYRIPCARVCQCDIRDELIIAECSEKGLTGLPIFDDYLAYALTRIYLNNNSIKDIDSNIVNTWLSAEIINLVGNPIDCEQIGKISKNVQVLSDCLIATKPPNTASTNSVSTNSAKNSTSLVPVTADTTAMSNDITLMPTSSTQDMTESK